MTDQEKRFLDELGITPCSWHIEEWYVCDKAGNPLMQYCDSNGIGFVKAENNQALTKKSPELFLALFKTIYTYFSMSLNEIRFIEMWNSEINCLLPAQTRCKTWEELVKLWEECEVTCKNVNQCDHDGKECSRDSNCGEYEEC